MLGSPIGGPTHVCSGIVLTGKLLDPAISIRQVVALWFASDDEFAALAERAVKESLSADEIKRAVRVWRADTYRI
jgi:hypothetical protein